MLPFEDENRADIRARFNDEFARSQKLIDECIRFLDQLSGEEMPNGGKLKAFTVGTLVREIRRYRSIIAECELGMTENAFVLTRTMYEGMLSLRFVLDQTIPVEDQSNGLRGALERLPQIPSDVSVPCFRLLLYSASEAGTITCLANDLNETDSEVARHFQGILDSVPQDWQQALGQGNYSGMRIIQLAEFCGMLDLHRKLYYQQCHVSHANDAISFVKVDESRKTASIQLSTFADNIDGFLNLASAIVFRIIETLEAALGLDADMEEIFLEYKSIAEGNESADDQG